MSDAKREFYRSNGVFLFESRVALAARLSRAQVEIAQICASLQDAEIDDDTDILVTAVGHLSNLRERTKARMREQREQLFPMENK